MQEDALVKALGSGKMGIIGLDVYENEPDYIHPGLVNNPNVCTGSSYGVPLPMC